MNREEVQKLVDETSYPNNYYFDVDTLEAKGQLKDKERVLKQQCPELYEDCDRFLDIGGSLGYFNFKIKCNTSHLVEPIKTVSETARWVKIYREEKNMAVFNCTFKDFTCEKQYDKVFIGNAWHYLLHEAGWDVVYKLAGICSDLLIMEAPIDPTYTKNFMQEYKNPVFNNYNEAVFRKHFSEFFDILKIAPAGTYGRHIIVMKRKNNTYAKIFTYEDTLGWSLRDKMPNIATAPFDVFVDTTKNLKYKLERKDVPLHVPPTPYSPLPLSCYIFTLFPEVVDFKGHLPQGGYVTEYSHGNAGLKQTFLAVHKRAINCGLLFTDFDKSNLAGKYFDIDFLLWHFDSLDDKQKVHYAGILEATWNNNKPVNISFEEYFENINNKTYWENIQ